MAEPSYIKHRTEWQMETTISGDTRADWSEAFALVPNIAIAYVWHASKVKPRGSGWAAAGSVYFTTSKSSRARRLQDPMLGANALIEDARMARFSEGQSGNPRGRPQRGTAIAELARTQVGKYKLIEKLGRIGAAANEFAAVDVDHQLRAIQLLLSYGYGSPRGENERGEGIKIGVHPKSETAS